jgi:hypothetical protein
MSLPRVSKSCATVRSFLHCADRLRTGNLIKDSESMLAAI